MKISLAPGPRQALSPQTAWGCLTTNLAVPGFGSLLAGRAIGYLQAVLGLIGLALTLGFGIRFFWWFFRNWSRMQDPAADPMAVLGELWQAVRWPLLGIGLFAVSWLWALGTSWTIVREARRAQAESRPPVLEG
jgi:hypothetical protein